MCWPMNISYSQIKTSFMLTDILLSSHAAKKKVTPVCAILNGFSSTLAPK